MFMYILHVTENEKTVISFYKTRTELYKLGCTEG